MTESSDQVQNIIDRRIWVGVALGTAVVTVSFWALLYAFVAAAETTDQPLPQTLAAGAFGMALVPLVFVIVAFTSGHPSAPLATVKAMALTLIVGIPALAIFGDVVTGLVVGFGAGSVAALRPRVTTRLGVRTIAVAGMGLVSLTLTTMAAPLALALAPSFPLVGVALADRVPVRKR